MRRNAWKDIANWRTETLNNCTKSLLHAWMTISSKRKNWKWVGELSNVCSEIVLTCLFLTRIGRLDILWSVNKRWLSIVDWVYSKTQSFAGDLEDSKSTSGEFSVSLEVEHSFPDVGCVRNKLQSLPVQLNLNFFFACWFAQGWYVHSRHLRDLVLGYGYWSIAFFQKPTSTGDPWRDETQKETRNTRTKQHINRYDVESFNVDHVTTAVKPSHFGALLYICEDDEAVIKMIIRGRSPTVRHVSRTHRVALDWLLDRINLFFKKVDTKNPLPDVLTIGKFTSEEWNHILRLFDIMSPSAATVVQVTTLKPSMPEEKTGVQERVVANSKPMVSFVSKAANQFQ